MPKNSRMAVRDAMHFFNQQLLHLILYSSSDTEANGGIDQFKHF